jgi:hypothetical protein
MITLDWPREGARDMDGNRFVQSSSNICLDLHGDPVAARLTVFSDGNHHMALEQALQMFIAKQPESVDIFYATTPPRVIVEALDAGGFTLGNLRIAAQPHVFISPPAVLDRLTARGVMKAHVPFVASRGNVLLVRKGNPRHIRGIADLMRLDVTIFLSNPVTETLSYESYAGTLRRIAERMKIDLDFLDGKPHPRLIYGESVHHREAPQAVADERADAAVVFHHLGLRYTRVFPDIFEVVQLTTAGERDPGQVRTATHIGLVGDGGEWGAQLLTFLLSESVAGIYRYHGLDRAN